MRKQPDKDIPGKLLVAPCFLPNIAGPYLVLAVGSNEMGEYTWAVVSGGNPTKSMTMVAQPRRQESMVRFMDFYKSHEGFYSIDAARRFGKSRIHTPTTEESGSRRLHKRCNYKEVKQGKQSYDIIEI